MNVFVLCTGRCGSTTFIKACRHISNYSSAHESRTALLGLERFHYPVNHIEADNRLSWLLGRLDRVYGDDAFYVHLQRDVKAVADSFVKRYSSGIINAYRGAGIIMGLSERTDPTAVAVDYCETVNSNIEMFLRNKSKQMTFHLERASQDFPAFCERIGAEVDMTSALSEFSVRHNASAPRKRFSLKRFSLRRFTQWRPQRLLPILAPLLMQLPESVNSFEEISCACNFFS